jgi:hypothetical protein
MPSNAPVALIQCLMQRLVQRLVQRWIPSGYCCVAADISSSLYFIGLTGDNRPEAKNSHSYSQFSGNARIREVA